MKSFTKIFLLLVLTRVGLAQPYQNKLDSLHLAINNAANDTILMLANQNMAIHYTEVNRDSALYYVEQTLTLARKLNLRDLVAYALNRKGYLLMIQGNYSQSLEALLKALDIAENSGIENQLATIYQNLGNLYGSTGNTDKQLASYLEAKRIGESINDFNLLAFVNMNLGNIYNTLGKLDSALLFEQRALSYFSQFGDIRYEGNVLREIGMIYQKKGKYDSSRQYLFKAVQTDLNRNNQSSLAADYYHLSNLYWINQQLDSSIIFARKSYEKFKSLDHRSLASVYTLMSSIYQEQNKIDSALIYLNLATAIKDSLNKIEIQKLGEFQNVGFTEQLRLADLEKEKVQWQSKLRTYSLLGVTGAVLVIAFFLYRNNKQKQKSNIVLQAEKQRSDELLLNILPIEVARELKTNGISKAKAFTMVTVMFTDFKDFTKVSEKVSVELLVNEIHICFTAFDNILQKYEIEKIKTIGDAYLCASGLPVSNYTHAVDMITAAIEIQDFIEQRKKEKEAKGEIPFEMRIGINTGPVVAGIVGVKKYAYDIWGSTVNIAARMEQNSEAGKINISESTYELVKDNFNCLHRGKIKIKNKAEIDMYFVDVNS